MREGLLNPAFLLSLRRDHKGFLINAALLIDDALHKAIRAVIINIFKGWNLLTTTKKEIYLVKRKLLRKNELFLQSSTRNKVN